MRPPISTRNLREKYDQEFLLKMTVADATFCDISSYSSNKLVNISYILIVIIGENPTRADTKNFTALEILVIHGAIIASREGVGVAHLYIL